MRGEDPPVPTVPLTLATRDYDFVAPSRPATWPPTGLT